jgi:hypothetical protein
MGDGLIYLLVQGLNQFRCRMYHVGNIEKTRETTLQRISGYLKAFSASLF